MIWDMCGEEKARRETWSDQCIMASSIMFVIDCSSQASMHVARDELYKVLSHEELNPHAPLLVWANKLDVVGSINETKLAEFLALDKRGDCEHRQWCVQGSVMHDHAKGLDHGLKWLYLALQQKPDKKKWVPSPPETIPNDVQAEVITAVRCVRIVGKAKLGSWLTEQPVLVFFAQLRGGPPACTHTAADIVDSYRHAPNKPPFQTTPGQ
jgi:GTPase SAR1 family protein